MKTVNSNIFKIENGSEGFKNFPFKTYLSFKPLIEFWEKELLHSNVYKSELVKISLEKIKRIQELNNPVEDYSIIEKYKDMIDLLMAVIYPAASWQRQISASVAPFSFKFFYKTPMFDSIVPKEGGFSLQKVGLEPEAVFIDKVINAYL